MTLAYISPLPDIARGTELKTQPFCIRAESVADFFKAGLLTSGSS
ncbi:Uncharacterized protein dnm_016950 [Desulfonema magnum]|uniref:Uncharacterized protein n=1 Tax=Desulfonema magnum TaxID=45655 RepID=A0A975BHR9_9BACT|nr:Uncharacterized protein dnm_016950 [Desulfonema magnum]